MCQRAKFVRNRHLEGLVAYTAKAAVVDLIVAMAEAHATERTKVFAFGKFAPIIEKQMNELLDTLEEYQILYLTPDEEEHAELALLTEGESYESAV